MTLQLDLAPEMERRLALEAERRGIDESTVLTRLIEEHIPQVPGAATLALLAKWAKEDATDDPEELRRAEEELEEFKRSLNANRAATGERLPFP